LTPGLFPCPLRCGARSSPDWASGRNQSTLSTIKALNETSWNLQYRYELHKGAHHGYALPDRDVFDKHAANRDWELIFAMFRRQIPLSPSS